MNIEEYFTRCDLFISGPVSVAINNCDYVFIEGQAFSWLLSANIQNVRELKLGSGAFVLDPTAANIGEHGPGLTVSIFFTIKISTSMLCVIFQPNSIHQLCLSKAKSKKQ